MATAILGWLLVVLAVSTVIADEDVRPISYNASVDISPDNSLFNGTLTVETLLTDDTSSLKLKSKGFTIHDVSVFTIIFRLSITHENKGDDLLIKYSDKWYNGTTLRVNIIYSGKINQSLTGLYSTKCQDNKTFLTGLDLLRNLFPRFEKQPVVPVELTIRQSQSTLLKYIGNSTDNIGWLSNGNRIVRRGVQIINPCSAAVNKLNEDLLDAASAVISYVTPNYTVYLHPDLYMPSTFIRNAKTTVIREEYLIKDEWSNSYNSSACSTVLSSVIQQRLGFNNSSSEWLALGLSEYFKHEAVAKMTSESVSQQMWQMELDLSLQMSSLKKSEPLYFVEEDDLSNGRIPIDQYKAGIIVKMLELTVGKNKFQDIIADVVNGSNQLSPTERLFTHLKSVNITVGSSNVSAAVMCSQWLKQLGYPIITATVTYDSVRLSQKSSGEERDMKWLIPVAIWTNTVNGTITKLGTYWLNSSDIVIPIPGGPKTLIFNHEVSGYYRVRLAGKRTKSGAEGVRVVADALALASLNKMEYADALDNTLSLPLSTPTAWSLAVPYLAKLSASLYQADRKLLQDYIITLLDEFAILINSNTSVANSTSGNTTSTALSSNSTKQEPTYNFTINGVTYTLKAPNTWDNRSMVPILESFCQSGFLCGTLYNRYHRGAVSMITTSNFTSSQIGALCAAAEVDQKLRDALRMNLSSTTTSRPKLLNVLACSVGKDVKWLLNMFLDPESKMLRQDFKPTISNIVTSGEKAEATFEWFNATWNNITNYMPGNQEILEDITTAISHFVYDKQLMRKVKDLVKPRVEGLAIGRAVERMKMNCWHRENLAKPVKEWLTTGAKGVHSSASAKGFLPLLPIWTTILLCLVNLCKFI